MKKLLGLILVGLVAVSAFAGVAQSDISGVGNNYLTKLLLGGTTTTFTDIAAGSNPKKVLSVIANTTWSSGVTHFGKETILFDGTGDGLTTPMHVDFKLIAGTDFTMSGWFYLTNIANDYRMIVANWDAGLTNGFNWYVNQTTGTLYTSMKVADSWQATLTTVGTVPLNTWIHIAYVKHNNTVKIYFNGIADANTVTWTSTPAYDGTTQYLGINYNSTGYSWMGNWDDFRVIPGRAVWTRNFTPPLRAN